MTLEVRKLDCLAGSWSADQINQAVKAYEAGRRHGVAVGTIQTQQNLRHARNQRRCNIEGESVNQKAISVRAPWWWFILHGGKTHENRDWYTSFRGSVLLHASKWWNQSEVEEDTENAIWMMEHTRKLSEVPLIDPP
jgi:hypothetical protein